LSKKPFLAINQFRIDTPQAEKEFIIPDITSLPSRPLVRRQVDRHPATKAKTCLFTEGYLPVNA
jgi:hypothetical protein